MLIRIVAVLIVLVLIIGGYYYFNEIYKSNLEKEYKKIALVIAETSVAAELYRNQSDSFLIARDSILAQQTLTIEELNAFKKKMTGQPKQWRIIFDYVSYYTDSVAGIYQTRLREPE
jgi:hypothetical protein